METPIIIEQPVKKKASIGAAVASLILGIFGFALAFVCYFGVIFRNVMDVALPEVQGVPQVPAPVVLIVCTVTAILCFVAFILGVVGLIRGIRRKTRRIAGIVVSAFGIQFSVAGMVLMCITFVVSSIFTILVQNGVFN